MTTQPRFTQHNTVGHTAVELAELNRRYEAMLATYANPDDTIRTGSDPHFFGPVPVRDYVARRVLMEFE